MKVNRRIILRICSVLFLVGLLPACSFRPIRQVTNTMMDYNLAAEKSNNEMLLLNVVRACKRHPRYFTSLSKLTGQSNYTVGTGNSSAAIPVGNFGASPPAGAAAATLNVLLPSFTYANTPVIMDVGIPSETKEFTQGILQPATLDTLAYYWLSGWPKDMILHLLVLRIEEVKDGKVTDEFWNDGDHLKDYERFRDKLREIFWKSKLVPKEKETPIGPKLTADKAKDLEQLIAVKKADLTLHEENGWYQLVSKKTHYVLEKCPKPYHSDYKERFSESFTIGKITDGAYKLKKDKDKDEEEKYRIFLRSPEEVLYYLGQIVRAEIKAEEEGKRDKKPEPRIRPREDSTEEVSLFVVTHDKEKATLLVRYEDIDYCIPSDRGTGLGRGDAGCSMEVLTFVSLLVSQQRSGMFLPATPTVIGVGR